MQPRSNISMAEEFRASEWAHYDAYDPETRAHLGFQKHVDIRTFTADSAEQWTAGNYGFLSGFGNYPGLQLATIRTKPEEETLREPSTFAESRTPLHAVDLETNFSTTDLITCGLPSFPLNNINTVQSYVEITSNPEGTFAINSLNAIVALSASTKALISGNSQFVVPRSQFEQGQIDLSRITGVRFNLKTKGTAGTITVTIMGLKLVLAPNPVNPSENPGWSYTTVDFDNWNGRLRKPTPVDGTVTNGPVFVQSTLWHADDVPGVNDPAPIDAEFGVVFNTGSQKHANNVTMFFREESKIFQTQLDLIGVSQAELDGRPQPDLGTVEFLPRPLSEFDKHPLSQIDERDMVDLERTAVANPVEQSWIYFTLKWQAGEAELIMTNSSSSGYIFPSIETLLENNANYLMQASVEGSKGRVRIYKLNEDFSVIQKPIFDSTLIDDDDIFRRRKGRIGWQATLSDPDAYIDSIRPRKVCFAEYRSAPLTSLTPVDGAQLFADFTANTQLWDQGFNLYDPTKSGSVIVTRDKSRSTSGESFKVQTKGTTAPIGLVTNLIEFTDFSQMEIHFDLWFAGTARTEEVITKTHAPTLPSSRLYPPFYPSTGYAESEVAMEENILARLVSDEGTIFPLAMPELETNEWQHIVLTIPSDVILQTGRYTLQILQPTRIASTWWVDSVSIFQRAVQWSARSVVDDPWKSNYAPWTDFREIVNVNRRGILLSPRGKELQLRARALRQDAMIKSPKLVPRYAALGRLVWPEEKRTEITGPKSKFSIKGTSPRSFSFVDESIQGTGAIVSREWIFGDGQRASGNQGTVTHTYTEPGTYSVSLIVTDRNGLASLEKPESIIVV